MQFSTSSQAVVLGCVAMIQRLNGFLVSPSRHLQHGTLSIITGEESQYQYLNEKLRSLRRIKLSSTPFDLDLYGQDNDKENDASLNPLQPSENKDDLLTSSSLAVSPETNIVLGINKYSHDTSLCAADAKTGEVLFAMSKERLTRKKHDGGNIAGLVELCLDQLELDLSSVVKVVMNNHHHRILPFIEKNQQHMEWEEGLGINGGVEDGYSDEYNILASVEDKIEISHHLAHAYSTAAQCPFDDGMVVVMDGMGETYRTMKFAANSNDETYVSDLSLLRQSDSGSEEKETIQFIPSDIDERAKSSVFDWREAESIYTFHKDGRHLEIKPIFKRFTEENTPPTLYNHGFENMDSLGAVYSRASSHIFGDWNACGKVMGLAPWQNHEWEFKSSPNGREERVTAKIDSEAILKGSLFIDPESDNDGIHGALQINKSSMMSTPFISRLDPDMFDNEGKLVRSKRFDFDENSYQVNRTDYESNLHASDKNENIESPKQYPTKVALDAIGLASRIQTDLEATAMDFVEQFKLETGQKNLCLAGGVALNSVLNGRLSRELGFEHTFIPPYPGDDGVSVGCCAFGLFGSSRNSKEPQESETPLIWKEPLSPYLGPFPTDSSLKEAIDWAAPWLDVKSVTSEKERIEVIVDEIASGGVVALYFGRSELGPRALGHRSILADPRRKGLVRFINEFVKKRESFRPFAPSVLAEEAAHWFELGSLESSMSNNVSPYMSITAQVKESKRSLIPAVTHVDGSSRLQTVTKKAEPFYHRLISTFYDRTGVPMVLNTSFNTLKGEPIVETPKNAIRSFLCSMGTIEILVMGNYVIKRKEADIRTLLGEEKRSGFMTSPSFPVRPGVVHYRTTFSADGESGEEGSVPTDPITLVQMPSRPMHNENDGGWFELLDELEGQLLGICDGTLGVNDIMTHFSLMAEEENPKEFDKITEGDQVLFENVVRRLVRLYEQTLISW